MRKTLVIVLATFVPCSSFADEKIDPDLAKANAVAKIGSSESQRCARKYPELAGVVMVGEFAYDRGCESAGFVFKGKHVEDPLRGGEVLMAAGWKDTRKREALAKAWVEAIDLRGLKTSSAKLNPDGTVTFSGSRRGHVGMRGPAPDEPIALTFGVDGNAAPTK